MKTKATFFCEKNGFHAITRKLPRVKENKMHIQMRIWMLYIGKISNFIYLQKKFLTMYGTCLYGQDPKNHKKRDCAVIKQARALIFGAFCR